MKTESKTIGGDSGSDHGSILHHRPRLIVTFLLVIGGWMGRVPADDRVDLFGNERFPNESGIFFAGNAPHPQDLEGWMLLNSSIGLEQAGGLQEDFGSGEEMGPRLRIKTKPVLGEPPVMEPPPVPEPGAVALSLMCLASGLVRRHRPGRV